MQNAARQKEHETAVRERLFTMRMSTEEWARAEKLAEHDGLTVAALVRMLLKERERELERELAAATKPTKPRGRK